MKKLKIVLTIFLLMFVSGGYSVLANTQSFIPNGGATSTNIYLPDQRKLISNANQLINCGQRASFRKLEKSKRSWN